MSLPRVLLVDDEPSVLSAIQRHLRGKFELCLANSAKQALELMSGAPPFAVVISDMQMPAMNGAGFLARVRLAAPHTTRVMLTGNSDQATAILAVNEGAVFRFLNKPCDPEALERTIRDGVELYELRQVEHDLIENTLKGTVQILTEIVSALSPELCGQSSEASRCAVAVAHTLGLVDPWKVELSALLLNCGIATFPPEIARAAAAEGPLGPDERAALARVPEASARLIAHIPRLESVARIVSSVGRESADPQASADELLGARIVREVYGVINAEARGTDRAESLREMRARDRSETPDFLNALHAALVPHIELQQEQAVKLVELRVGMLLSRALETSDGRTLLREGHILSALVLERIRNHAATCGLREPFWVRVVADENLAQSDDALRKRASS
jgi:CheY-like chemotaxis protein